VGCIRELQERGPRNLLTGAPQVRRFTRTVAERDRQLEAMTRREALAAAKPLAAPRVPIYFHFGLGYRGFELRPMSKHRKAEEWVR